MRNTLYLIYAKNPNIDAVLLAHPPHAMAFAVTDAPLDPRTIPESYILLRDIAKRPFNELYTTPEAVAMEFKGSRPVLIFNNDCVIVTDETLLQAFDRLEVLEFTVHSILNAADIGVVAHLNISAGRLHCGITRRIRPGRTDMC
jgi:L-fuculose-phosphate aldolase